MGRTERPELGSLAPGCCRKVKRNSQGSPPDRPALAQALLHLLLLFGLVMGMALLWHPHQQAATLLLLPYLAWLTVAVAITHHLWRDSLCPEDRPRGRGVTEAGIRGEEGGRGRGGGDHGQAVEGRAVARGC